VIGNCGAQVGAAAMVVLLLLAIAAGASWRVLDWLNKRWPAWGGRQLVAAVAVLVVVWGITIAGSVGFVETPATCSRRMPHARP